MTASTPRRAAQRIRDDVHRIREDTDEAAERYGREDRPFSGYLAVTGAYAAGLAATALIGRRVGVRLPERVSAADLALLAVATHKISRIVTKDSVTSPFRAPFTRFEGQAGPGEVQEDVRGTGLQKALGELITCPFCLDQWVATGLLVGLVVAPRPTRWLAATFAVRAGADALQFAYAALQQAAED